MRNILCPLCEHDHTTRVYRRLTRGLTITTVVCLECGLVYHNPVIEDQDRRQAEVSNRQWHTGEAGLSRQLRRLERRWRLQWPLIQPVFQPGWRVLEIGCGLGLVGGRLKNHGARVWAVEPDPEQAAYARQHFGLTVFPGRMEDASFETASFDLILASHVIEHFPEPLAFLRQVRTFAHPDTWLFLETPNVLAPKVSFRRMFSPAHNFYFAPRTLGWLLLKAGWQEKQCRVFRRDAFQVLARPGEPVEPDLDPRAARQVMQAIARHRYLYYLKLQFIWRKIPWCQKNWMNRPQGR
ncbi:MAG TPA: class I SAM-dependent methyltransferase [Desulfobaccales bacterium]|nr:class I SAM-dependent methyltransferase [Desulfobaccales bacterium]